MIARAVRKLTRIWSIRQRMNELQRGGVSFLAPNYLFYDRFDAESVVIDVGCGSEAELALHMVETYGVRAYGIDPTRKHAASLRVVEIQAAGRFTHIP